MEFYDEASKNRMTHEGVLWPSHQYMYTCILIYVCAHISTCVRACTHAHTQRVGAAIHFFHLSTFWKKTEKGHLIISVPWDYDEAAAPTLRRLILCRVWVRPPLPHGFLHTSDILSAKVTTISRQTSSLLAEPVFSPSYKLTVVPSKLPV